MLPYRPARTDHPRLRGEHAGWSAWSGSAVGSPPPARGAPDRRVAVPHVARITPACAGSTPCPSPTVTAASDHPRLRGEHVNAGQAVILGFGSPPPARGARDQVGRTAVPVRITPACAGSTSCASCWTCRSTDHPRLRGEHLPQQPERAVPHGSPPPARGAPAPGPKTRLAARITPACAGSTFGQVLGAVPPLDHPRLRGEHADRHRGHERGGGSPPPARGALSIHPDNVSQRRITPACAGSTGLRLTQPFDVPDHPRLRGEHCDGAGVAQGWCGSPPPARGALRPHELGGVVHRITPACAGSTLVAGVAVSAHPGSPPPARGARCGVECSPPPRRITPACAGSTPSRTTAGNGGADHPRLRGEHGTTPNHQQKRDGSPPPARGARHPAGAGAVRQRITPACAGSTAPDRPARSLRPDHPRLRGEHAQKPRHRSSISGSPPPARGALGARPRQKRAQRITPACAGSTPTRRP